MQVARACGGGGDKERDERALIGWGVAAPPFFLVPRRPRNGIAGIKNKHTGHTRRARFFHFFNFGRRGVRLTRAAHGMGGGGGGRCAKPLFFNTPALARRDNDACL